MTAAHSPFDRRTWLQTGLGVACGLPIAAGGRAIALPSPEQLPGFGRAKRVLLIYVYGAWSQLDTFDPKPDAPEEIRGEFGAIESCLPGVAVCEHLPRSSQVLNRCTLIRSMCHPWNIHSASYTLTGNPDTELIEGRQRHPDQWPYIGGVVDYFVGQGEFGQSHAGLPVNVMLPWRQSLYARPNKRSGTFGGFLGSQFDPLWTEFHGEAPLGDPFRAITDQGRFAFGAPGKSDTQDDALLRRHVLLNSIEARSGRLAEAPAAFAYARLRSRGMELLGANRLHRALALEYEPASLRDDYGLTLFGQACLTARRLLEADVKFVTVVWDEFGQTDESWDTHYDHHSRMKEFLLPGFDRAFATLIRDLEARGLLDETLVLCLSEHGRTPRFDITSAGAPGRGHWSRAYCQLMAGAGIPQGRVIGGSDAIAGDVTDNPIDPKDILCTAYHLVGLNPRSELQMLPGRMVPLVAGGRIISELLG